MADRVFRRKPLNLFVDEAGRRNRLRRVLGPLQLMSVGIVATIGSGIFVMAGVVAHDKAGPALVLSLQLGVWFALGLSIYFLYGRRHSRLSRMD